MDKSITEVTAADLIISGGTILTIDENDLTIKGGAVAIKGSRILAVGKADDIARRFRARRTIDAGGKLVMPGLINTHAHAAMCLFRGVADDVALDEWLTRTIFPLEEEFINRDSAYRGSLLACAEMILSGTTTFSDMYFFEEETGRAAIDTGMRAVIGEGVVTAGQDAAQVWQKKKALTEKLLERFASSSLVRVAVEPHAPYTCSPEVMIEAKDFARSNRLLFATHLAETRREYKDCLQHKQMTPAGYLDSLGLLDDSTLLAHCVWMGKGDARLLKKRGAKVAHCPQSNMKLGSGLAPIQEFLKEGVTVGLGTDGAASNNSLDLLSEMKAAALLAKVRALDARALSARDAVRMATIEGAKALGMEKEIGSLEAGKQADIIILDLNRPHLVPIYDCYSHLVYAANGADVCDSIIDGRVIMRNRKLMNVDLEETFAKAQKISKRIRRKLIKTER